MVLKRPFFGFKIVTELINYFTCISDHALEHTLQFLPTVHPANKFFNLQNKSSKKSKKIRLAPKNLKKTIEKI